ncbi:MAG: Fic family protein [Flavobacteriales bacterium]|nr:Fic family protein [Flavobacteriales bacterium]
MEKIKQHIAEVQKNLERLTEKKIELQKHRPFSSNSLSRLRDELALEWTYNSNAIEGNTLTLQETRLVLEDGMTVGGKSLREHFEAVNHKEAIDFLQGLIADNFLLTDRIISDIHFIVLKNILPDYSGRYRTMGVRIGGANFTPPNALKVDELMGELISEFNSNFNSLHPVVMATWLHHRFVWIHPFADGNGRTIRLVYNLFLMSMGYPPAIILKADRKKYYAALNAANEGNYSKLLLLMCQASERSLDIYLSNLNNYSDEYKPIGSIVEEENLPYGQEYLSLLARQGKLSAYKEGHLWHTRPTEVKNYIESRKRKRK